MELLISITIGVLFASGIHLMLSGNLLRLVLGFLLLSQSANLFLFASGGLVKARSPIIPEGLTQAASGSPDPLSQALILTAIVIGFAATAFFVALVRESNLASRADDPDGMKGEKE